MTAVIIDDEPQAIASLEMELKQVEPQIEIIARANSVQTGVKVLKEHTPDLIFLDIRLTDGLGFDILGELGQLHQSKVIFTTAYDQYAIKAFKHGAFDYLLKPIDQEDLQETLQRIIFQKQSDHQPTIDINNLVKLSNVLSGDARIALTTTEGIYMKKIRSIIYIQADGNYTKFFLDDGKRPILISRTLKDFEEQLKDAGFVRTHSSYLINLAHLESFHPKDSGHVVMSNGEVLPVSVRKKSNLMNALK